MGRTRLKINVVRAQAARLQVACQKFDSQPLAPLHWFSPAKNFHEKRSSSSRSSLTPTHISVPSPPFPVTRPQLRPLYLSADTLLCVCVNELLYTVLNDIDPNCQGRIKYG